MSAAILLLPWVSQVRLETSVWRSTGTACGVASILRNILAIILVAHFASEVLRCLIFLREWRMGWHAKKKSMRPLDEYKFVIQLKPNKFIDIPHRCLCVPQGL